MGGKTSGKRKGAPAAPPKQLPAEGATNKRTPQSTFDAAAGNGLSVENRDGAKRGGANRRYHTRHTISWP